MVNIEKAVLYVLDTGANMVVDSQLVLDDESLRYLGRLLTQLMKDPGAKTGVLAEEGRYASLLRCDAAEDAAFLEQAGEIGQAAFDCLVQTDDCEVYDFVLCSFSQMEQPYVAVLLLPNLKAYAHRVVTEEGVRSVQFRMFKAFLPTTAQKVSDYMIVDRTNHSVRLKNGKRKRNDEAYELMSTLFACRGEKSQKEAIQTINTIITEVSTFHGSNTTEALNKAKVYMLEQAEAEKIEPEVLAERVFEGSKVMQEEFKQKAQAEKLPESLRVEKTFTERVSKMQKIRTDTGIEISIPAVLLSDPEIIEFINNEDGTISIEIKNIEQLVNR